VQHSHVGLLSKSPKICPERKEKREMEGRKKKVIQSRTRRG
jgi:hypothetical protein